MRVGILMSGHVENGLRAIAGDFDDMFAALLRAQTGDELEFVSYDVIGGELPPSPAACDAWILSGSRSSVYDDEPWIHALAGFIRELYAAGARTAGICFGHQMIAHALGGRVEKAATGWGAGAHLVEGVQPGRLLFMHQDQVTQLPPGGELLGAANHCPVAMFSAGSMVGVQGHPEFPVAFERALLDGRVESIGTEATAAALASLDEPTAEAAMARFLLAFLRSTG